jgi:hypothetical protein
MNKCEKHTYIKLTQHGCLLCEGEKLAKQGPTTRTGKPRAPRFNLKDAVKRRQEKNAKS